MSAQLHGHAKNGAKMALFGRQKRQIIVRLCNLKTSGPMVYESSAAQDEAPFRVIGAISEETAIPAVRSARYSVFFNGYLPHGLGFCDLSKRLRPITNAGSASRGRSRLSRRSHGMTSAGVFARARHGPCDSLQLTTDH